jgi:hypothetical protein
VTRAARVYFAGCAALIGFVLAYALPIYARLPSTFYDPVARRWQLAVKLGPIPMGYYGQILWGISGALVAGGASAALLARRSRAPSENAYALWAAWALTAVVIVLGYFTWNNWP